MKAVLRYLGGKNRLAPWIIRHFPAHTCYVEPYGGSLGVLLNKAPAPVEICNDKDGEIVNLFRVLRSEDAGRLIEAVMLTPYSRDELNDSAPAGDAVERARRLLVRSWMGIASDSYRSGRSGLLVSRNRVPSPATDWDRLPETLRLATQRLKHVHVENRDALDIMQAHDGPETLHYVDPPYMSATRTRTGRYAYEMTEDDHRRLLNVLLTLQGKVVLSGYDNELYNSALQGWHKDSIKTISNMASPRLECLWLNYNPQLTLF